jgi:hypothetical protein
MNGKICKYKARLVTKGYTQKHGVIYDETSAPIVKNSLIRLLALAAEININLEHYDVKTAFLYEDLEEMV